MRLGIIGGGITGLAAAWEGMNLGAEVVLLEAGQRFGGKIFTQRDAGCVIEHGPDSFVAYRPAALKLIDEVGLTDEVITAQGTRKVQLRAGGRMHPLPDGMGMVLPTKLWPFVTTSIIPPWGKLRAGLDLVLPRLLDEKDISIGDFLTRRLGREIVRRFADPMVGGIYGASVDELSLDAVLPSLRQNEQDYRSLMRASFAQGRLTRANAHATPGADAPFRTLRGGLGQLVDRLVKLLTERGADLHTYAGVQSLSLTPGETRLTLTDGSVNVDAVVLATGPADAARLLGHDAPSAGTALAEIPLASTTVMTLAYPSKAFATPVTSHGWLEAGDAPVSGITISSAKWTGRAPVGQVLIRAFIPDRVQTSTAMPEPELEASVRAHVETQLAVSAAPIATWITHWDSVMPKYTVGHLQRAAAVDKALADTSWRVAGSALHGVGVPDCIADGRTQARNALAASGALTIPIANQAGIAA